MMESPAPGGVNDPARDEHIVIDTMMPRQSR